MAGKPHKPCALGPLTGRAPLWGLSHILYLQFHILFLKEDIQIYIRFMPHQIWTRLLLELRISAFRPNTHTHTNFSAASAFWGGVWATHPRRTPFVNSAVRDVREVSPQAQGRSEASLGQPFHTDTAPCHKPGPPSVTAATMNHFWFPSPTR